MSRISQIHHLYWICTLIGLLIVIVVNIPLTIWSRLLTGLNTHKFLAFLFVFIGFMSVSLIWSVGQTIDVWVFMFLNMKGKRSPWMDWLMLAFTQLGNFIFAMILTLLFFGFGHDQMAIELILGMTILMLSVQIMKTLIHRKRPFSNFTNIRIVGSRAIGQSFPSGHTSQAFFLATLLWTFFGRNLWIGVILYLIASLVGITRIYVGMHYPRDVLGGAALGIAMGLLGVILNARWFS